MEYQHLENSVLLDMLAEYTARYTRMMTEDEKAEEFYAFKRTIEQLTYEIELRKNLENNSTISNPDISFAQE